MKQAYSVLMSVYQKENPEYLRAAVESVLGQTVPPEEVVLVCDGPADRGIGRSDRGVCEAGNCFSCSPPSGKRRSRESAERRTQVLLLRVDRTDGYGTIFRRRTDAKNS